MYQFCLNKVYMMFWKDMIVFLTPSAHVNILFRLCRAVGSHLVISSTWIQMVGYLHDEWCNLIRSLRLTYRPHSNTAKACLLYFLSEITSWSVDQVGFRRILDRNVISSDGSKHDRSSSSPSRRVWLCARCFSKLRQSVYLYKYKTSDVLQRRLYSVHLRRLFFL